MKSILIILGLLMFRSPVMSQQYMNDDKYYGYGEFQADEIKKPKFVQLKPINLENFDQQSYKIETLGYSEIRVFIELSKDDFRTKPLPKTSAIRLILANEMTGLGSPFKNITFKNELISMIDGWAIEKVYGRKTNILVLGENLPKGKYTFHLSYYLIP